MPAHQEQFARVKRYYDRFKRLNDGMEHAASSDSYLDDVHAFFQNAYHLKDWLKNDAAFKRTNQEIEDYVTNTQPLAICADICNSTKHLVLTSAPRSGAVPSFGKKQISIDFTDELSLSGVPAREHPTKIATKIQIEHGPHLFDAFDIATKAVLAWDSFLE
jgi:hypothetical protein